MRPYIGIERPKGYRRQWKRKSCYRNAALIAMRGEATYVEGICVGIFPFQHAWITLDGKHAIDQTLPNAPKYGYFGIEFPAKLVVRKIADNNSFSPLLDDPEIETILMRSCFD